MQSIKITSDQIERAKQLYPFKELNGSITKGQGNTYGALGEIIVYDLYKDKGFDVDFNSTYDYDLIINKKTIDVKTKKFTSRFKPNTKWTLNISDFNTTQKCDYYFFLGISDDFKECFLYGYIKPANFYKISTFNKKGDIDPNGNGSFTFMGDCHNLEIEKLTKFKSF
jgi:hypothetical protein